MDLKPYDRVAISSNDCQNCIGYISSAKSLVILQTSLSESDAFSGFIDWEKESFSNPLNRRYMSIENAENIRIKRINVDDIVDIELDMIKEAFYLPKWIKTRKSYRVKSIISGEYQYFEDLQSACAFVCNESVRLESSPFFFSKKDMRLKRFDVRASVKDKKVIDKFGMVYNVKDVYPFYGYWKFSYINFNGSTESHFLKYVIPFIDKSIFA